MYIEADQDERLRLLAQRTGASVAEYIRKGIDLILHQYDVRSTTLHAATVSPAAANGDTNDPH